VVCYGSVHAGVTWNAEPSPEKQSSLEGDEERLYNDGDDALERGPSTMWQANTVGIVKLSIWSNMMPERSDDEAGSLCVVQSGQVPLLISELLVSALCHVLVLQFLSLIPEYDGYQ
jgi:hypothetical protein